MPYSPTTVSRLESELCKAGLSHIGYTLELDPTANDEGHQYYDGVLTAKVRGVTIDFEERYSQRGKVEMRMRVPAEKLECVCKAIADTHGSTTERIGIQAIVTVKTALAVCKALDGMKEE
jgi:hypothetical protein